MFGASLLFLSGIREFVSVLVVEHVIELAHLRAQYEAHGKAGIVLPPSTSSDFLDSRPSSLACSAATTPLEEHSPPNSPPSFGDIEEENPWMSPDTRIKNMSDIQIGKNATEEDLLVMFKESDTLEEQGDILHFLAFSKGISWDTRLGVNARQIVTVKDLLKELYEKACQEKKWALVRHIAGILGKRVEDLAKAITDILVRQKQVTIGMPPNSEHTITRPLPSKELREIINKAHGGDQSTAMLTQELLVFLAMFIRTEPQLFSEMLRLRVGLIIQVMASELGRALKCTGDDASEHLLNLSPYEMKMLLHHILSGKEFGVKGG